jgi:hypothetical protein
VEDDVSLNDYDYRDHPVTEGVVEPEETPATPVTKYVVDNGEKKWVEFRVTHNYSNYRITTSEPDMLQVAADVDDGCDWAAKGLWHTVKFSLYPSWNSDGPLGHFLLAPMPGCCGVVISTDTWIRPERRGQGFSKAMQAAKAHIATLLGYTLMLATIQMENIPELKSALGNGWKVDRTFTNKRTGKLLAVITKELK